MEAVEQKRRGRPSDNVPRRKVSLYLAEAVADALQQYGSGSLSKGVERAASVLGLWDTETKETSL